MASAIWLVSTSWVCRRREKISTTRGVHHRHVSTITTRFTGVFKTDAALKDRFLRLAKG